jgi:hypothetical protein
MINMAVLSAGTNLPVIGHITVGGVLVGIVVGYIFAGQIRRVPGISKLPTA